MELLRAENVGLAQEVTRLRAEVLALKKSRLSKVTRMRQLQRQRDVLRLDRQRLYALFAPKPAPPGLSFLEQAERIAA